MLIDDKNKFLFIHIPKNAGSSMRIMLEKMGGRQLKDFDTHVPCSTLKEFTPDKFNEYFKFAFVRNPWDRLYSMYKFTVRRGWCSSNVPFSKWIHMDAITEACKFQEPIVPIQQKPQVNWIMDSAGNSMVDFIGRFESLNDDFNKICQRLNTTNNLMNINASPGKHYKEAYDTTSKKFVERYYEKDIETFKYVF